MRIILLLAAATLVIASEAFADGNDTSLWTMANSTRIFSNNFFKTVADLYPNNLITSPFSAQILLSMIFHGARGTTADILRSGLVLPDDEQLGLTSFKSLIEAFNATQGVDLHLANKLYTSIQNPLKDEFQELLTTVFSSKVQGLDFNNATAAAKTINTWCEDQTNGRIKDLIQPDNITPATALVLVNAIYFKGKWAVQFDPNVTTDRPFYLDPNTTKSVPTMYLNSEFRIGYLPELNANFIDIPYEGNQMSMIIVLPKEIDGLKTVVDNISQLNWTQHLEESDLREVDLYLPRFEIESKIDLKKTLRKLGLGIIFKAEADFSGIADVPLQVSKIVQKAFIKVNEEGSEAAVATGFIIEQRMARYLERFEVNRPAYYAIRHTETETILFSGLLTKP